MVGNPGFLDWNGALIQYDGTDMVEINLPTASYEE